MQQPPKAEDYDPSVIEVLRGLTPPRLPWQLLLTGEGPDKLDAEVGEALVRILDLFPSVSHLVVQTTGGSVHASRDFPSGHTQEVDRLLAGIFQNHPTVTAVTFPACAGTPSHTATPDDPFWSAGGKALNAIVAAMERGEITPEEATARLANIYRQDPA